jgi:penicillin-binding protein 2
MSTPVDNYRGEPKNVYRFGVFALAVAVGITALSTRMAYLQIVQGQAAYQAAGDTQETADQAIPSTRGLIRDATGTLLVTNVVDYAVTVTPSDLPKDQELEVANRLGSVLNLDPIYIETKIDSTTGSLYVPIKIADGVSAQVGRFIEENYDALPGVKVVVSSKRQYLTKDLFSDVIGYEGQITASQYANWKDQGYSNTDIVGQAGLENQYEQVLRGTPGTQTVVLDAAGKPIPGLVNAVSDQTPGDSLTLNLDSHEQTIAQTALAWGLSASRVTKGVIIVENPQNGKILAMVSLPSYNDQLFSDGISDTDFQKLISSPDQPLLNKAIGAQYAPGSTYKLVTATAGLVGGPPLTAPPVGAPLGTPGSLTPSIDTTSTLLSQPFIQIGQFKYWEWDRHGWGPLNIYQGLARSSDTFFYQLANLVGLDKLTYWADQYGFGKPTGIDLPETATGIVPTNDWKQANYDEGMFTGEIMQAGIGQGYDVATPLQLLNAYCALANGGTVWQPQVVSSIKDGTTGVVTNIQPVVANRLKSQDGKPISPQILTDLRVATRQVVTSGHTNNLVDLPIKVAGKTGTAEFGVPDKNNVLPYHEWFVGYVPASPYVDDFTKPDSQLAVVAFIYGANTYANVATEVVKYYLMMHFKLKGDPFNIRTAGYIPPWVARKTNFYGQNAALD